MSYASFASRAVGRARLFVCTALVLAAFGDGGASAQPPHTFAGPNGLLVFESERGSTTYNTSLYVGYADGLGARRLTTSPGDDENPAFSPDGTRVLFNRSTLVNEEYLDDLYVINTDGTGLHAITSDGTSKRDYVWSHDGTRIAYVDEQHAIWVINADGSNPVVVAPTSQTAAVLRDHPMWSPDDTTLAFTTLDFSQSDDASPLGRANIFMVNADGTGMHAVTDVPHGSFATTPRFSPSGTQIAHRVDTFEIIDGQTIIKSAVYVIAADGTGSVRLTALPSVFDEVLLDWSHASNRLLFQRKHHETHAASTWTMLSNGTARVVAVTAPDARESSFSPDGLRILHRLGGDGISGDGRFVSVALNGTNLRVVNARPDHNASWGVLYGDVTGKDVVRLEIHAQGINYLIEGPLEMGDVNRIPATFPSFQERVQGTAKIRSPRNRIATITFNLFRTAIGNSPWQGTLDVHEPLLLNMHYSFSDWVVDFATGAGSRSWVTWTQICGPLTCFKYPTFHSITFRVDDRS